MNLHRIAGAGLILSDTSRICRFGHGPGSEVPATFEGRSSHGRVFCTAPPARSGYVVDVELSIDGGGSFVGRDFTFTYFHEAVVSSVSPNSGPAVGATLVRVTGFNFAPTADLSCLFGWRHAPATCGRAPGARAWPALGRAGPFFRRLLANFFAKIA